MKNLFFLITIFILAGTLWATDNNSKNTLPEKNFNNELNEITASYDEEDLSQILAKFGQSAQNKEKKLLLKLIEHLVDLTLTPMRKPGYIERSKFPGLFPTDPDAFENCKN